MTDVTTIHQPVLLRDCVDLVAAALAKPGSIAVDCTLGLAGHSTAFLKASPNARLIGIDRDTEALALATKRMEMEGLADRFTPVHAAFDDFSQVLSDQGVDKVNAVFMDLGLSSLQIDETERGFSYSHDAPLDMRMDVTQPLTAEQVLAGPAQSFGGRGRAAGPPSRRQPRETRLPGAAHRSQRRTGQACRHAAANRQPPCSGRTSGGGVVPLVGRQNRQSLHEPRA